MEQRRRNGSSRPRKEMTQDRNRPCKVQHSNEKSHVCDNPEFHNDEDATVSDSNSTRWCIHDFPPEMVQIIGGTNMRRSPSLDIEETIVAMKKRLARDKLREVEMQRDVEIETGIGMEETDDGYDGDSSQEEEIDPGIDTESEWEESDEVSEWSSSPSITDDEADSTLEVGFEVDERMTLNELAQHGLTPHRKNQNNGNKRLSHQRY